MTKLFAPFTLRDVTFKNRIAVSPMSQYRARDGMANDWHMVHLGRFALGGSALVYAEATAVEDRGRRTHGDLGLWRDGQIEPLIPVTRFIAAEGAVPGVQLAHAGRKASERRPWHEERPLDDEDHRERGEDPWTAIGPSALPYADGWPAPHEMTEADIQDVITAFGAAARRSVEAGFQIIEVYAAHGFLIHQFLSPISNQRTDRWGGDAEGRMRLAVEVARVIRAHWPERLPLAFRLSATDWVDGGLEVADTVPVVRALAQEGVDMIDCSSGGSGGKERPRRMTLGHGFQAPFAEEIKRETGLPAMTVGFLWEPETCAALIDEGRVDMLALARELLDDPNWPLHVARGLGIDPNRALWHEESGWWLNKRDRVCAKLGLR